MSSLLRGVVSRVVCVSNASLLSRQCCAVSAAHKPPQDMYNPIMFSTYCEAKLQTLGFSWKLPHRMSSSKSYTCLLPIYGCVFNFLLFPLACFSFHLTPSEYSFPGIRAHWIKLYTDDNFLCIDLPVRLESFVTQVWMEILVKLCVISSRLLMGNVHYFKVPSAART